MRFALSALVLIASLAVLKANAVPGATLSDKSKYGHDYEALTVELEAALTDSVPLSTISRRGSLVDSIGYDLLRVWTLSLLAMSNR
jgi:hypothetical protein